MQMKPHLKIILRKMCEVVGADFAKINFKKSNWYLSYSWTQKQEDNFCKWMADYLYSSYSARKEVMYFNRKSKKHCIDVSKHFVSNYGWKIK